MRNNIAIVYIVMIFALLICAAAAKRSRKNIGTAVSLLSVLLLIPVLGNFLIIVTESAGIAEIGYNMYFIGVDLMLVALMYFSVKYCKSGETKHKTPKLNYVLISADIIQILLNHFTGHVFELDKVEVGGAAYYNFVPLTGLLIHRVIVYFILVCIIAIFAVMTIRMPRVYKERYAVILATMLVVGLWQSFYVFVRVPVNTSMIGYGVFDICVFYFSIIYRPHKFLDRMLTNIVSDMPSALFVFDPNKKCLWANDEGMRFAGIEIQDLDLVNERLVGIIGKIDTETFSETRTVGTGSDMKYYHVEERIVSESRTTTTGYVLIVRDITEDQLRIKREMYNAIHDSLTGLYTREYLYERITEKLRSGVNRQYYIIFVDVKNFKIVNDIFSSSFGDHALKVIADWIKDSMSENCLYGRLAGDTFGALVPEDEFDEISLNDTLASFIVSDGTFEYHILIHLGIYKVTESDTDVQVMFDRAHLALSTIRDEYKTHIAFYDEEIRKKVLWDQHISAQLSEAIAEKQLCPYLQPIVDNSGKVVGAEALVRWINPVDGFMPPGLFIPVFEKNGMIVEVDKYMWRSACEILAKWQQRNWDIFISVNISPKDFYFIDVPNEIIGLVKEYGIAPEKLRIEITETVMMNDAEERMKVLSDLRSAGFIVEMDDFGSGYSSLNLLKDMPVDVLKIDMKFLSRSKDENKSQKIIQNIIKLSNDLNIASLTEGVESEKQFRMLTDMSCNLFQGYYFAKPMPVDEFEKFYREQLN